MALDDQHERQQGLGFLKDPEDIRVFEYAALVTSLPDETISVVCHYRDRADCENNFDEIKNQWGWGGFVTRKVKPCRLIARIIAVADTFDAITSDRAYRRAAAAWDALAIMRNVSGSQLDGTLVELFENVYMADVGEKEAA